MKQYPEIPHGTIDLPIYAFDKLDGSNVRAEWSRKRGFYKFGSRTCLLDKSTRTPFLGEAPELIQAKYNEDLSRVFVEERWESAICFFEFWGPQSFAGNHFDEPHTVTLFDVNPYKKGILPPKEYLDLFSHLDIAKLLYQGNPNATFLDSVRRGQLEGMTFEGVICKTKHPKKTPMPLMFKVKNLAWVTKLKEYCGEDDKLFQKLL